MNSSKPIYFSLITPTFGRPDEVVEFLESLLKQEYQQFEVIVSDGTPGDTLRPVISRFLNNGVYPLTILYTEHIAVSPARNAAAAAARGDYLIFLDSDCIIPDKYLSQVVSFLEKHPDTDVFGGPDLAAEGFTPLQKAINYSMTSFLTTGGIRGGRRSVTTYLPRGFNMGVRKKAFDDVGGYSDFLCAEDIELSIRLLKAGYKVAYIPEAGVYHKRRTTLKKFFRQVYRFGAARLLLNQRHPGNLKITHLFPLVFSIGLLMSLLLLPFTELPLMLYLLYLSLVMIFSTMTNESVRIGFLTIITTLVMMVGYGYGMARNGWEMYIKGNKQGIEL
ncbi:glycosyltransferase [Schleiferia thermophila]|uniref:Cellulose synthase/poly-beta-1,6-N-acetylglucosamine synthase-like glycosyltransferase n=1 Tax=Schleiferia thermophila TaxID=884107 RepID=A0A369A9W6_9FLAO|nr:glycosyltransferase [Schleiferia thermophila]RCX04887.1 cellulose synthase/poly-beta-1,6-N-acetylglucosamine synthase-like glycosyltransferase [Schleiferia thermophila]GCD79590.1 glycosyl transferase [Schleiferia thermophila]